MTASVTAFPIDYKHLYSVPLPSNVKVFATVSVTLLVERIWCRQPVCGRSRPVIGRDVTVGQ